MIRKLLAEGGTLMVMGMPKAGQEESDKMIALHPSVDPKNLYSS